MRRIWGQTVALVLMLAGFALAEFPWVYPPSESLDPNGEIDFLVHMELYDEATEKYLEIANSTDDQSKKAAALLNAADLQARFKGDVTAGRVLYAELAENFPKSRFEVLAQIGILEIDNKGDAGGRTAAINELLRLHGAPSFAQLGELPIDMSSKMIEVISPEIAYALGEIYISRAYELRSLDRLQEALQLARFGRVALDPVGFGRNDEFRGLYSDILATQAGTDTKSFRQISREPLITPLGPRDGETIGSNEPIQVELTVGDYRYAQVDFQSLEIVLDGEDVTYDLSLNIDFDESLAEDVSLEKMLVTLNRTLSQGEHTITLSARTAQALDLTYGDASKTWSFFVSDAPPTPLAIKAVRDTILSKRNQHQNEGANSFLTLEKIQGKASRSTVAFDLSAVDLNTVSRATLVLTVDPSQQVNGWGNGRTISAQTITTPWQEGDGKSLGLKKKDQITGSGTGATWFSPSDEDISNDSANSAVNWNGAEASASPPTSPAVQIVNFQSGEVTFDVTADVLNGAEHGWLILKDQENVGSKVSFYSREGAAAAGNPDLAPRLLLEFGQVASNSSEAQSETLLSRIGFGSIGTKLRPVSGSEVRSLKQLLQENQVAALAVEQLVSQATLTNPVANWTTRLAYRSWVSESIQVAANLEMARS